MCAGGTGEVADAIGSLLDKSLIRRVADDDGEARFGLLVSLREFAAEQLLRYDELAETSARHARFFAESARRWEATVGTDEETATWPRLGSARADLLAAYAVSRTGPDVEQTLWLATGLGWYWYTRGSLADAAPLIDFVAAVEDTSSPDAHAAALVAAGVVAFGLGRLELADVLLARSAALPDSRPRRLAFVAAFRGHVAREHGRIQDARQGYTTARAIYQGSGSVRGTAWAAHDLGLLASELGDLTEAETLLREAVATFRVLEYDWALAVSACMLASVLLRHGSVDAIDEPAELLGEALRLHDAVGDRRGHRAVLRGDLPRSPMREARRRLPPDCSGPRPGSVLMSRLARRTRSRSASVVSVALSRAPSGASRPTMSSTPDAPCPRPRLSRRPRGSRRLREPSGRPPGPPRRRGR